MQPTSPTTTAPAESRARAGKDQNALQRARGGAAGLAVDLHSIAHGITSASNSPQVLTAHGDSATDVSRNPYYELQADEEFVIKNYRLIKKKKDGNAGIPWAQ